MRNFLKFSSSHCKSYWHPNQTCDQARSRSFFNSPLVSSLRSSLPTNNNNNNLVESTRGGNFVISGGFFLIFWG